MTVSEHLVLFNNVSPEIIKEFTLNCFLHHKIKLIRNWGSSDESDQLAFKDTTLLQFCTRSNNVQILIKPKDKTIRILRTTSRGRKLFLYFTKILELMMTNNYRPNF